jgi:hypothetical protein
MMKNIMLTAAFLCAAISMACGQSKSTQCSALVDEGNKGQSAFEKVDFDKPAVAQAAVDKIKASNTAMEALKLEDEKLKMLRSQYVKTLGDSADAVGRMVILQQKAEKAAPAEGAALEAELGKARAEFDSAEKGSIKVIAELNTYCTGSK